jgi:hypothetical protein
MKIKINQLKRYAKTHPKKSILILLLGIFLVTLTITGIVDTIHQKQVSSSLDKLQQQLEDSGFENPERSSGCWHLQTKLGPGAKRCEDALELTIVTKEEEPQPTYIRKAPDKEAEAEADRHLTAFAKVLDKEEDFSANGARGKLPDKVRSEDSIFLTGNRGYKHLSGIDCIAGYMYISHDSSLKLHLTCDTTSWFVRNIDRGLF